MNKKLILFSVFSLILVGLVGGAVHFGSQPVYADQPNQVKSEQINTTANQDIEKNDDQAEGGSEQAIEEEEQSKEDNEQGIKENQEEYEQDQDLEKNDKSGDENEQAEEVDVANAATKLSIEEAMQVVKDQYPDAIILGVDKEDENGTVVYGITFSDLSGQYNLKVDAKTGKVLKKESENDDQGVKNNEKRNAETGNNEEESVED